MDWADLAELLTPVAPTIGKIVGGALPIPFGASIGEAVGGAVASALGVAADPTAIAAAAKATPQDVLSAQLQTVEANAQAQFQAFAEQAKAAGLIGPAQVAEVGATQRAELVTGLWYQRVWRPLAMLVWITTWPFQLGTILWQIGTKDPAVINNLATVVTALAAWNAGPAALAGVYSWNRSQEKIASIQ